MMTLFNANSKINKVVSILEKYLPADILGEIIENLELRNYDLLIVRIEYARLKILNERLRSLLSKEKRLANKKPSTLINSAEYLEIINEVEATFNELYEELDKVLPGVKRRYEELTQ